MRRETGKELEVRVLCDEGIVTHIGPESCAGPREGTGEASAGERVGQLLSGESFVTRAPTRFRPRKATRTGSRARAPGGPAWSRPWHARMLLEREPGDRVSRT